MVGCLLYTSGVPASGDGGDVVGGLLIDEVIEPIGKKQVGVAAPYQRRHGVGIIAGEIILREGRMNASGQIPLIFIGQGVAVIFAVTGDKDLPGILGGDNRPVSYTHLDVYKRQGMHLVGTHGDAVQGAVILIRAVVGALLYGTLDAMVGTTGFHIESLLSFDRFYDGVMASC